MTIVAAAKAGANPSTPHCADQEIVQPAQER